MVAAPWLADNARLQAPDGLGTQRRDRDREFRRLVLDRVQPMRIGSCIFKQTVARAQRTVQCGGPAGMRRIDSQHQPVEKPPPIGGGAGEQTVHRRRQPDDPQMICKVCGGARRFAVDPVQPRRTRLVTVRGIDAGAEGRKPERTLDLSRHRP